MIIQQRPLLAMTLVLVGGAGGCQTLPDQQTNATAASYPINTSVARQVSQWQTPSASSGITLSASDRFGADVYKRYRDSLANVQGQSSE